MYIPSGLATTNITKDAFLVSVDAVQVVCGYQLSGTYQVLPRVTFYLLLWFAFFSRTSLILLLLWTSVCAIQLSVIATYMNPAILDTDSLVAYADVLLALLCAPTYMMFAKPLKNAGLIDRPAVCLWMVLLWTGLVSFAASMKRQPASHFCTDAQGFNITDTSTASLSFCTFQCPPLSQSYINNHPIRPFQTPTLIPTPSSFYAGAGHVDHWVLGTAIVSPLYIALAMWMATKKSYMQYVAGKIKNQKFQSGRVGKKAREDTIKFYFLTYKISFFGFIIVVYCLEDTLGGWQGRTSKHLFTQWWPLVALGIGFVAYWIKGTFKGEVEGSKAATDKATLAKEKKVSGRNPNITAAQKKQNAAAMPAVVKKDDASQTTTTTSEEVAKAHEAQASSTTAPADADLELGLGIEVPKRPQSAHVNSGLNRSPEVESSLRRVTTS